jgi:hypothetical protein
VTDEENRDALAKGTPLEALTAIRSQLSDALLGAIDAEPKIVAGLSRELRAVIAEQERRGGGREESKVDDLAAKRAERRAGRRRASGQSEAAAP